VERVRIIWDRTIVCVKSDGLANIVKIESIANPTPARMAVPVFPPRADTSVCVTVSREKIATNLIHVTRHRVKMADNVVTSMGHPLVRASFDILEINVKLTTVQIAILMLTASMVIANAELDTKAMVKRVATKLKLEMLTLAKTIYVKMAQHALLIKLAINVFVKMVLKETIVNTVLKVGMLTHVKTTLAIMAAPVLWLVIRTNVIVQQTSKDLDVTRKWETQSRHYVTPTHASMVVRVRRMVKDTIACATSNTQVLNVKLTNVPNVIHTPNVSMVTANAEQAGTETVMNV